MTTSKLNSRRLRILVAIASYGGKNESFLRKIIRNYQNMAMEVAIVVLSEAPKDLGPEVKVIVGLPSKNPWSLPFAHKQVFAQNVDRYDLFAYSEDDMDVTEQNIKAFLQVSPMLQADEIAGFLRYETDQSGAWHIPEAHDSAHWKPHTVKRRGEVTVAEFSNEHAGFYILTQSQLKQVIVSGNYLRSPYQARYGLPETAATDPYTCCGFRKVICISALENFLIHHLPNLYIGKLGRPLTDIMQQVQILMNICNGAHPASSLCVVDSKILRGRWSKSYDEEPCDEILNLVPQAARTILSVGCGSGALEARLLRQGMEVAALPLDSVIGAVAARRGIEMVYGDLDDSLNQLAGRTFDCVLITNLLHLQADPGIFLKQCAGFVGAGGAILVAGPNFNRISDVFKRQTGFERYDKLENFSESGINFCGPGTLLPILKQMGLNSGATRWLNHGLTSGKNNKVKFPLGSLTARNWILRASRTVS